MSIYPQLPEDEGRYDPVGLRIRHARHRNNLTQAQLAEMLGVDPSQISRWENREEPSAHYLRELVRTLGVSARFILGM